MLLRQHQRGREITDYIERVGSAGQIGTGQAEPLAAALASMVRMYIAHATWEDTVVFPAWKKSQSKARLEDLAESSKRSSTSSLEEMVSMTRWSGLQELSKPWGWRISIAIQHRPLGKAVSWRGGVRSPFPDLGTGL